MSNTYNYKPENMGPASQELALGSASVIDAQPIEVRRVLRNTYALLALTLLFSDNWFDSNFGNNERFLLITSALELVYINALIDAGARLRSPARVA